MRHAQTAANKKQIACGLLDSSLTSNGIQQAKETSKAFSAYLQNVTTIYHSSLIRSQHTAKYLKGSHAITMIENSGINEQSFGEWEGLPWELVLMNLKEGKQPPGGESRSQFSFRIQKSLNFLLSHHSLNSLPVIVAHGGTFFAIGHLFGCEVINISNCHLCYFEPQNNSKSSMPWSISSFDCSTRTFIDQKIYYKNINNYIV